MKVLLQTTFLAGYENVKNLHQFRKFYLKVQVGGPIQLRPIIHQFFSRYLVPTPILIEISSIRTLPKTMATAKARASISQFDPFRTLPVDISSGVVSNF
jgi:hypothetical protein